MINGIYPNNLIAAVSDSSDPNLKEITFDDILIGFDQLTEHRINALLLYYKDGIAPKDIAKKLNVNIQRTYQLLNGSVDKIKKVIKESRDNQKNKKKYLNQERLLIKEVSNQNPLLEDILDEYFHKYGDLSIVHLNLPNRPYNALMRYGIERIDQLIKLSRQNMIQINNIGIKGADVIEEFLKLELGNLQSKFLYPTTINESRKKSTESSQILDKINESQLENYQITMDSIINDVIKMKLHILNSETINRGKLLNCLQNIIEKINNIDTTKF